MINFDVKGVGGVVRLGAPHGCVINVPIAIDRFIAPVIAPASCRFYGRGDKGVCSSSKAQHSSAREARVQVVTYVTFFFAVFFLPLSFSKPVIYNNLLTHLPRTYLRMGSYVLELF